MKIKFFCPRWGSEDLSWNSFCLKAVTAGFDGIESSVPFNEHEKTELALAVKNHNLLLIGQYHQSFAKDFLQHKEEFKHHLENIVALKPILIDSQTGKDYYSAHCNQDLFIIAKSIADKSGVMIVHETHRNKALFAAHEAEALLRSNPDVKITADFSHWCNVSESLLEQQQEAVKLAISRTVHIHARVGHAQSAQVTDPRAPEWKTELQAHLSWWDQIVEYRAKSGADLLTITPEFGQFPYMVVLPYTNIPVAEQWDINVYMMNFLKERYQDYL